MDNVVLTNKQARAFILRKQGLLGEYRFVGKEGIMNFVKQVGCIQFDPIDICGRNHEMVLQARINGLTKQMIEELLYHQRLLWDYVDKNQAILSIDDWPYFERRRQRFMANLQQRPDLLEIKDAIVDLIQTKGPISSQDLEYQAKVDWYWGATPLGRAALDAMYYSGELVIHHKQGNRKYYGLATDLIPLYLHQQTKVLEEELDYVKWHIARRIGALGLLWNRPSDAFLGIYELKANIRNKAFGALLQDQAIIEVRVEGQDHPFYCMKEDEALLAEVQANKTNQWKSRLELIAPLDNMLWDRNLIRAIFEFDYKWEIYTPVKDRKYGHYIFPLLYGDQLIGRVEVIHDKKLRHIIVKKIWYESKDSYSKQFFVLLVDCFERLKDFHHCEEVIYAEGLFDTLSPPASNL